MIVGMDFGTTNSGMSFYDGRRLQLVPLDRASANPYVARSALYITNRRHVYMGRDAVEKYYEQNINRKVKYQRVWVGEITLEFAELPAWVRDVSVEKDVEKVFTAIFEKHRRLNILVNCAGIVHPGSKTIEEPLPASK